MEVLISEQALDRRSKILITVVAFLQGLGLYALYYALENKIWPTDTWTVIAILASFLLIVPTSITLSYRSNYPQRRYWSCMLALAALFIWIPLYGSWQISERNLSSDYFFFIPLSFLLAFIALFFLKSIMREERWLPSYESLFGFSWHNFLSFTLAWLFNLIFWLILMLWGALFKIVDINFFHKLFQQEWFLYPALSLAFAYGVVMFRTKINAVGAVQRILRALISFLLPMLLAIAVMFVVVLPFTGVDLIWHKGYGSDTILGFVALSLFFFNAVYQDAKEPPYGPVLNKLVQLAVMVLLALLALASYGVSLRIAQYGLTVDRILAVVFVAIMFFYLSLYTAIIVFKSSTWSLYFGKANTVMALCVALIIVAMFTPVLNMTKMSVDSQMKRLKQGKVTLEKFDFRFLGRSGMAGKQALLQLQQREDVKASASISKRLEIAMKNLKRNDRRDHDVSNKLVEHDFESLILQYPVGVDFDEKLWNFFANDFYPSQECLDKPCLLLQVDLNDDSIAEYVLFYELRNKISSQLIVKNIGEDGIYDRKYYSKNLNMSFDDLKDKIESGRFSLVQSPWRDLTIGEEVLPSSNINR